MSEIKNDIEIMTEYGMCLDNCKVSEVCYYFIISFKDGNTQSNFAFGEEMLKETLKHIEDLKGNENVDCVKVIKGTLFHFHTINKD